VRSLTGPKEVKKVTTKLWIFPAQVELLPAWAKALLDVEVSRFGPECEIQLEEGYNCVHVGGWTILWDSESESYEISHHFSGRSVRVKEASQVAELLRLSAEYSKVSEVINSGFSRLVDEVLGLEPDTLFHKLCQRQEMLRTRLEEFYS
jgi:hypothetical protein